MLKGLADKMLGFGSENRFSRRVHEAHNGVLVQDQNSIGIGVDHTAKICFAPVQRLFGFTPGFNFFA